MLELQGKKTLSKETKFFLLSDRFGWTPDQIRQMDYNDIETYIQIIAISNKQK